MPKKTMAFFYPYAIRLAEWLIQAEFSVIMVIAESLNGRKYIKWLNR